MMTIEERERRAYADGDLVLVEALRAAQDELQDLVDAEVVQHAESAFEEGFRDGYNKAAYEFDGLV